MKKSTVLKLGRFYTRKKLEIRQFKVLRGGDRGLTNSCYSFAYINPCKTEFSPFKMFGNGYFDTIKLCYPEAVGAHD